MVLLRLVERNRTSPKPKRDQKGRKFLGLLEKLKMEGQSHFKLCIPHQIPLFNQRKKQYRCDDGTSVGDDINLLDVGKKTGDRSVTDTMDKGSKPQTYGDDAIGIKFDTSAVGRKSMEEDSIKGEKDKPLNDVENVIDETPSGNNTRVVSDDTNTVANSLRGLREATKSQLNVDEMNTMSDSSKKMRRLRKGVPTRHARKESIFKDQLDAESDDDVVFVFEKASIGRKRTRASLAAQGVEENSEHEIDLEELERTVERRKAAKKGKTKIQGSLK
ncbi:hypothetical protein LIER_31488 [Lithospermum erythrorhizon]|uniref:Uncharacterized protein n=1 Tax=Lithospermum erythrorhizon TaxID=34254 RepID=A0AAV3RUA5_LITER